MICCQILLTCPFPGHLAVVDKLLTILSSQLCQIPKVSRPWLPATAVVCWGRAPGHTWWKHRHIRGHSPFLDYSLPGSHLSGPVLSLEPSLMYISRSQVARCSLWLWSRGLQRCSDCSYQQLEGNWLFARCVACHPSLFTLWSHQHERVLDVGGAQERNDDCYLPGPDPQSRSGGLCMNTSLGSVVPGEQQAECIDVGICSHTTRCLWQSSVKCLTNRSEGVEFSYWSLCPADGMCVHSVQVPRRYL